MGENDYPVITVSGAEWQAAQDAKEAAQHSLRQLKAAIALLAKVDKNVSDYPNESVGRLQCGSELHYRIHYFIIKQRAAI